MIHIIYKDNKPIGQELKPITPEEQEIVGEIRDLIFFGIDETAIKYSGLKLINPKLGKNVGNIYSLTWIQKKYT